MVRFCSSRRGSTKRDEEAAFWTRSAATQPRRGDCGHRAQSSIQHGIYQSRGFVPGSPSGWAFLIWPDCTVLFFEARFDKTRRGGSVLDKERSDAAPQG